MPRGSPKRLSIIHADNRLWCQASADVSTGDPEAFAGWLADWLGIVACLPAYLQKSATSVVSPAHGSPASCPRPATARMRRTADLVER